VQGRLARRPCIPSPITRVPLTAGVPWGTRSPGCGSCS
jgi:hypothetical protein